MPNMLWVDIILVATTLVTIVIMVTMLAYMIVRVPFVPTPWSVVRQAITLANPLPGETVIDLGAGDARTLITASRYAKDLQLIGYELVPTVWLYGKLRLFLSRTKAQWLLRDLFKADVSKADVVFVYLLPSMLPKVCALFDAQLQPGTRVVSYAFQIPDHTPEKQIEVQWLGRRRMLSLYRW